ncbi:hypothetical protein [Sphaerobacter sp.]|uniref:hypothetical protein n=1 Tax=Sphaerobacter sp. TaxID=2099654 RepID=UPI001DCA7A81|nr:hypothetical protein [Sphaerobacter sp.]MBX5445136.1 hypothetical protein [Sphaerobacter sp.]
MARDRKKTLPQIRYPRGRRRVPDGTTVRTHPYRVRQTSRGRVPATQEDVLPFLTSHSGRRDAGEQATPEA